MSITKDRLQTVALHVRLGTHSSARGVAGAGIGAPGIMDREQSVTLNTPCVACRVLGRHDSEADPQVLTNASNLVAIASINTAFCFLVASSSSPISFDSSWSNVAIASLLHFLFRTRPSISRINPCFS